MMLLLSSLAEAAASHSAASHSALPLILQLHHEHAGLAPPGGEAHPQATPAARRRALQSSGGTLTRGNTAPLRLKLDFSSLYPESAPEYTACFAEGKWFRRGLPDNQPTPPADGLPTCVRGAGESASARDGCWGRCQASDVIHAADRARMIETIRVLAAEVSELLAVRPVDALQFRYGRGAYERALRSKGYPTPSRCAADCATLSGVAVDPRYCEDGEGGYGAGGAGMGFGYDAVLSLTKPPGIQGVAGTGASCASDSDGRPLWLVFALHESLVGVGAMTLEQSVNRFRGLLRHEALHGLGFVNSMFNYARDSRGERKHLIKLRPVVDTDGARDEVWMFVRGRAYELAQAYFECDGNATDADVARRGWDGLPLMGLPEAGRGAHWETRIMRDDVMSYGFRDRVSSITLAALEDLGFYLANYSRADCMSWGHRQGCAYVRSRCGDGRHDASAFLAPADHTLCKGDPYWARRPDSYLASKCEGGNNPCGGTGHYVRGSRDGVLGATCDAQCHYGPGVERAGGCLTAPSSGVESAGDSVFDTLKEGLTSVDWNAWLIPLIWLAAACFLGSCLRSVLCPRAPSASRRLALSLNAFLWLLAITGIAGFVYLYLERDTFRAFVTTQTIIGGLGGCGGVLAFTFLMGYALLAGAPCLLTLGFWFLVLLVVAEVLSTVLVIYWIHSLGYLQGDTLNALFGDASRHIDDALQRLLQQPAAVTEGIVCRTYQTCCRSVKLANVSHARVDLGSGGVYGGYSGSGEVDGDFGSGTSVVAEVPPTATSNATNCLAPTEHQGGATDLELSLVDPSTPNFCAYTSGASAKLLFAPPPATCQLIETLDASFHLDECRETFCESGIDGYLGFVRLVVELIQRYAVPLCLVGATLVLAQLVYAVNLRRTAQHARSRAARKKEMLEMEVIFGRPVHTNAV